METKRNESGFIIKTSGVMPQLIDWLSSKYNFKFRFKKYLNLKFRLEYIKNIPSENWQLYFAARCCKTYGRFALWKGKR
jgi:hypothetical protein